MCMTLLNDSERETLGTNLPEWQLDGETLSRRFEFSGFLDSIAFVTRVAVLAEIADHHPDIDIRWNKVTLALTTHEAGGLTEKDSDLATAIDASLA